MMTIVSHVKVRQGQEPAWDEAMRERIAAAREQPGFVSVQVCIPVDALDERMIVGTWQTRADWEAWHGTGEFRQTRARLEEVDEEKQRDRWYEVVAEERR